MHLVPGEIIIEAEEQGFGRQLHTAWDIQCLVKFIVLLQDRQVFFQIHPAALSKLL